MCLFKVSSLTISRKVNTCGISYVVKQYAEDKIFSPTCFADLQSLSTKQDIILANIFLSCKEYVNILHCASHKNSFLL